MSTKRASNGQSKHKLPTSAPRTDEKSPEVDLDDFDRAILGVLGRNGRATNSEVGEAVGLSASAASRRVQMLEESGAIRGYRAVVDDRLLGKSLTVYIRVTLERESAEVLGKFEAAVRHCHDVVSCHLMAGQYDYMIVARVSGIEDYGRLHQKELSRLPGVTRLETSFTLRDVLGEQNSV